MNNSEPASQPTQEQPPEFVSARARRRRAQRRAYFPTDQEGRAALFAHLARRAFPSYELFVFSFVSGLILGLGYILDSQALLIFGILVAPLMTAWIGISLATIAGSLRFFLQTIAALLISSVIIFLSGALAGFASHAVSPRTFNEAFIHSRLWWPDIVTITIAAIILTISFVRSEERPYLPSALLTYGLFLPLCAAGFGWGSGISAIWPAGLFVFLAHFAWATILALLSLFFLRFYPTSGSGLIFTGLVFVILIAMVTALTGFGKWAMQKTGLATPPPASTTQAVMSPTVFSTITSSPKPDNVTAAIGVPTSTPSHTPTVSVKTPLVTLPATDTSTSTVTAEPTAIVGLIRASEGGGAFIREKPGGLVLATLANGATVTILPDDLQEVNRVTWVHVFATVNDRRVEGWMIQSVLQTATPVPYWAASSTPSLTPTQ